MDEHADVVRLLVSSMQWNTAELLFKSNHLLLHRLLRFRGSVLLSVVNDVVIEQGVNFPLLGIEHLVLLVLLLEQRVAHMVKGIQQHLLGFGQTN